MSEKFHPKKPHLFYYASLDRMREAYEDGVVPALYDAICCYRLFVQPLDRPCPEWIWDGIFQVLEDRLRSGKTIGRGRTGNERARYLNDMMHLYRWEAVKAAREEGHKGVKAFKKASAMLKGSFARGTPGQVEKSHKIVNPALKHAEGKKRFYLAKYPPSSMTGM